MADEAMVILKDIADKNNATVGWDANTKAVTVNDKSYTPEQLTAMGGVLKDGRWSMSEAKANELVGVTPQPTTAPVDPLQAILDSITNANKGYMDTQIAGAGANRDAAIAELEATLNKAVADGQMSVLEAKEAFEAQKKNIDQVAYQDSEQSQVQMQNMGIQNSQQGMGMMASDQARKQSLVNDNIKNRDNRILQISERIKSLTTDANIQKNKINADYNTNVLRAQGEAAYNTSNAIAGIQQEDYFANKSQDFQKWLQDDSQDFTAGENQADRDFQSAEAETEREWRSTEAGLERDHAITMQNNEFVHDKTMTAIKFKNDLTAMEKQAGYNLELEDARSENAIAEYSAKADKEYDMITKEKSDELLALNRKYTDKNSLEYKTEEARIKSELKTALDATMQNTVGQAMVEMVLNKPEGLSTQEFTEMKEDINVFAMKYKTDKNYQTAYDTAMNNADKGVSREETYAQLKGLNGLPNDNIKEIIDRMYTSAEWQQAYDILNGLYTSGMPGSSK